MSKKFLIADDHFIIRTAITFILESSFKELTIDYVENYPEVLKKISQKEYDLLILDVEMPGSILEHMITEIKTINRDLKILIFTSHNEDQALTYLYKGAEGYLNKTCEEIKLLEAVKSIFSTGYYYPQEILHKFVKNKNNSKKPVKPLDLLSEREIEIYNCLIKGNGVLETSNYLNIHMSTVSTHKKRILKKLNINSIAELVHLHNKHYP